MQDPINRRNFLAASLAAAAAAPLAGAAEGDQKHRSDGREWYELRLYHFHRGAMTKRADDYFKNAMIPACRRHGTGPVGVFNVMVGPDSPTSYVLIVHPTLECFATLPAAMRDDEEYHKAAGEFGTATPSDPAYLNLESSLHVAFPQMPRLEVPGGEGEGKKPPRIFELRTYRSHSMAAHRKKVEMFEKGGEIAIFRRTGLQPVFFSQMIVGRNLHNITYMLTYPDLAAREKNWKTFVGDPEWKKLSTTPGYTDPEIVASISNVLLSPAPYSQV